MEVIKQNNRFKAVQDANMRVFAQWCALPEIERSPKTQQDLAKILSISEVTLSVWKNTDEFKVLVDEFLNNQGRGLVPTATAKLKDLMTCGNKKVELDAAKDVLSRWGMVARTGHLIQSIVEMYHKHNK